MLPSQLKLTSLGHCYVLLPEVFVNKETDIVAGAIVSIKSLQNDIELVTTWNGHLAPADLIQLDLTFAKANKLSDELVIISLLKNIDVPECSQCQVELINSCDIEILSEHSDVNILDSCRLVTRELIIPIYLSRHVHVLVKIKSLNPDGQYGLLTKWTEMHYSHDLSEIPKNKDKVEGESIVDPIPFVSYNLGLMQSCPVVYSGSLLVTGERGSGKTFYLKESLMKYNRYHGTIFNCQELRGKRPENIKKKFVELLNDAVSHQPSIIALDDVDAILANDPKHEDERGSDAIYKKRLIDYFCYFMKQLERSDQTKLLRIVIISTCRSIESLDSRISQNKGRKYFNQILRLNIPDTQERVKIIKVIFAEHKQLKLDVSDEDLDKISKKCNSCMPSDLRQIVERSIIKASSKSLLNFNSDLMTINLEDLTESLIEFVPFNLKGVSLQDKSSLTFEDVGGMKEIKEKLVKIINLQFKYPKLYKKSPIRPQNSVLLYGPSGCGKTLIAEALTNQDFVNSIYVRGPELLSKYIGASEAAVRDLFKRAEMARPCIIFFDEFESLVSKRGSDSTGVTDRVVNQFLTLMDGVEKLSDNIFIIAATSRPDMIDPAILRPGRLDTHIYCPVPSQEDRLDIIRVLIRNIKLVVDEAKLVDWSYKLNGYTGADIRSFLYTAQIEALHELVGPMNLSDFKISDDNGTLKDIKIEVDERHLERAFNDINADIQIRNRHLTTDFSKIIGTRNLKVASRATLA